jgi:hypothetical protein
MGMLCLGFMGFMAAQFWLALYMQQIQKLSALEITVRLLPMVINGVLVNVVCGLILHKVSNKLLMLIASLSYTTAFLIMSFMKEDSSYWAYYFPPLLLMVVGADIEFNVANVSYFSMCTLSVHTHATHEYRCTSCRRCRQLSNPSPVESSTRSARSAPT